MSKTRRVLRVAVALLVAVCMVVSCTAGAYAEVITLVAFSSVVVVSAVLTACGLIMTQGNSPDAWESLCKTVAEIAQLPATLSLSLIGGLTYLEAGIINAIVQAANQQEAFEPKASEGTYTKGDFVLPYLGSLDSISAYTDDWVQSYSSTLFVLPSWDPSQGSNVDFSQNGFVFRCSADWVRCYLPPLSDGYQLFGFLTTSNDLFQQVFPALPFVFRSGTTMFLGYCFRKISPSSGDAIHFQKSYFALPDRLLGGSISAEFPWELDPDGYAGVEDDGSVALPGAWPDAGVVIEGAPALPLTVPADTVIGAAEQAPTDARGGVGTKVDADNPPITDAKVKEAVEQNKLSLTIIDYFPFCIPFDLVKGVQLLQAPVAEPIFDVPIKVPYVGEQTLHIDLTEWDGVFVITRWFLLLGFVAGLALVTSKVIKW